jgi:hypothetical protein
MLWLRDEHPQNKLNPLDDSLHCWAPNEEPDEFLTGSSVTRWGRSFRAEAGRKKRGGRFAGPYHLRLFAAANGAAARSLTSEDGSRDTGRRKAFSVT